MEKNTDGLSPEMIKYYNSKLLENLEPQLVHMQFDLNDENPLKEPDPVHPTHYMLPEGLQVIDVELAMFGKEAVMSHCLCTAVEYLLRCKQKNGDEDVKKAGWWVNKYLELAQEGEE